MILSDSIIRRFNERYVVSPNGCWLWTGTVGHFGYGILKTSVGGDGKRGNLYAHRASWIIAHGDIPSGQCVLHHCDNPPCVNPQHLFLGTKGVNAADMVSKGRQARGWTIRKTLTVESVRTIRQLAGRDVAAKAIAVRIGCSVSAVRHVLKGRVWCHVV